MFKKTLLAASIATLVSFNSFADDTTITSTDTFSSFTVGTGTTSSSTTTSSNVNTLSTSNMNSTMSSTSVTTNSGASITTSSVADGQVLMTTKSADGASSTTMNMSQGNIQLQKNDLVNNISSGVTISGVADATKNDQAVNLGQMNRTIDAATSGAATASAKADTATTAANTASTKADAATNTANTANTKADAATATATQAKTMSTTALSRVDAISGGFTAVQENMNQLEQKVSQVEKDSFRGIAALAAINNAPQPHKVGNTTFAVGFGGYKSESAIGLSMAHQVGQAGGYAVISGGIGYAMSGDPVYKVGAAWEF